MRVAVIFGLRLAFAFLALLLAGGAVPAAELSLLSAAALRAALADFPAKFEAKTGYSVKMTFGTAGAIRDRIVRGEKADIVILPPSRLADLAKSGLVDAQSRHDLVRVRLGAAVRKGTARPPLATEAAFAEAIRAAPSVGIADPARGATSGIYLSHLFARLGLADIVKPKLHVFPDGAEAMAAVARGEIALGLGQASEITPAPGAEMAGYLPDSLQLKTIYAEALVTHAGDPGAAKTLLAELASPAMASVFAKAGFDPPR